MIAKTTNSALHAAYQSKMQETKTTKQNTQTTTQSESSKVDKLKESIDSGEYKVDMQATAEKMAESLL